MKKFLTYLFLSIYLLSYTEMRQVLKLPNLVEHYISHELRDENNTFFSFVKMHYLDEQQKDSDYSQDIKLPFKTHDFSFSAISMTVPPKRVELVFTAKKKSLLRKSRILLILKTFTHLFFKKSGNRPRFNFLGFIIPKFDFGIGDVKEIGKKSVKKFPLFEWRQ